MMPRGSKPDGKTWERSNGTSIRSAYLYSLKLPYAHERWQRYTPQFLLMRLRHSITAQDDASEALASAFVSGNSGSVTGSPASNTEIDDFVKEFKQLRKTYHKRVLWAEKWGKDDVHWRED
jgi:hypothetical protein